MYKFFSSILLLFMMITLNAQDLESLTYEEANNFEFFKKIKNGKLKAYTSQNGTVLKIGDTITLGEPYRIDDNYFTITLGDTSSKTTGGVMGYLNDKAEDKTVSLDSKYKGQQATIVKMKHAHMGSKKKPINIRIAIDPINGAFGMNSRATIKNVEEALEKGEIVHSSTPVSKESAIAMLKSAKEEYDLGILTEAEFNEIKIELLLIIRDN